LVFIFDFHLVKLNILLQGSIVSPAKSS